jgi:hypothetical protein
MPTHLTAQLTQSTLDAWQRMSMEQEQAQKAKAQSLEALAKKNKEEYEKKISSFKERVLQNEESLEKKIQELESIPTKNVQNNEQTKTEFTAIVNAQPKISKKISVPQIKKSSEQWIAAFERLLEIATRNKPITYDSTLTSVDQLFDENNNTIDIDIDTPDQGKKLLSAQIRQGIDYFLNALKQDIDDALEKDPALQQHLRSSKFVDYQNKLKQSRNQNDYKKLLLEKLDNAYAWLNDNKGTNPTKFAETITKLKNFSTTYFNHNIQ